MMEAIPECVAALVEQFRRAADEAALSREARLEAVSAIRRAIVPKRKPGKKKNARIDSAYRDYQLGMRGLKLYRKHIPNFRKLSRWRRKAEQRRLTGNLQKRAERDRKRQRNATNPPSELSPRQSQVGDCRSDKLA